MNISVEYTLSYEDWAEAQRTHRTPIHTPQPRSWPVIFGGIAVAIGIFIFLAIVTIRPIPNSPVKGEFYIDPTIAILLIPHACLAAVISILFRRSMWLRRSAWLVYLGLAI